MTIVVLPPVEPMPCVPSLHVLFFFRVQELIVQGLCESRGGLPGLSVLMSLLVSVDVKNY